MPQSRTAKQPSVIDSLMECMQILTEAKVMPDAQAHMQVLDALQQGIVQYIQVARQKSIAQTLQGGQQRPPMGQPGQPGMGAGGQPGGMGGGPPGASGQPPASVGMGGMPGLASTPNPDELRRVLAGPAAVKG